MEKSPDAFRTISEVAEWLGVQAHVLRFWESKFTQVKPVKRAGGRRYYRPSDMLLLGGIKRLLHDDGLTIKGVQKTLREQSVAHVSSLSQELCDVSAAAVDAPGDTSGGDAIVVPFKSAAAPPEPEPETTPQVAAPSDPKVSAPDVTTPEKPVSEVAAKPVATPDPAPAPPVPVADAPVADAPSQQADPKTDSTPKPPAPAEEKPILPSFLHRPARKSQPQTPPTESPTDSTTDSTADSATDSATESLPESPPEPVAARIRPIMVDAPDPPDENDLPYVRGPLTQLADLDRLTTAQIAEIAPLAEKLQAWLARSRGAGAP